MIQLIKVTSTSQKEERLKSFDPRTQTWLVPDLKSKLEIQKRLLIKHSVLEEEAVLRASELWHKLALRIYPDWRFVSQDFARSFLAELLIQQDHSFAKTPGAAQTLLQYVQQLLPVLAHEEGPEQIREWMKDHQESYIRWRHWFELSLTAWREMVEHRFLPLSWSAGLLVHQASELSSQWQRELTVDLGSELTSVEAEILAHLSKQVSVTVLEPSARWIGQYQKTLVSYGLLDNTNRLEQVSNRPGFGFPQFPAEQIEVERYSTMITEVKAVTGKIRKFLDAGVKPQDIAIVAPDIESYWPALSSYLAQEGIPVQKSKVARLQSFSEIESWMAELRLQSGKIAASDLERSVYSDEAPKTGLPYEKFKRLFSVIYDDSDLDRWAELRSIYDKVDSFKLESMKLHEFLSWAVSHWPKKNSQLDGLERIVKKIYQESPIFSVMSLRAWLEYLENSLAKEEVLISEAVSSGIHALNVREGEWVKAPYGFMIGLTAESLRQMESTGILFGDVQSLAQDTGFFLSWPDKAQLEFETLWMLEQDRKFLHLSAPASDFSGSIQAPSLLWLLTAHRQGREIEAMSTPQSTRWDELQRSDGAQIAKTRGWSAERARLVERSILQDLGESELEPFADDLSWSLSASQIENYFECPFKFAANKIFGLSDFPDVDLDIDRMTQGQMLHKLFELLVKQPFRSQWDISEVEGIVDQLPEATKSPLADRRLWKSARQFYVSLAQRFIAYETQWRLSFPDTETVGKELSFEAKWSVENGELRSKSDESNNSRELLFRGVIDRVDRDTDGNYVVLDYKSTDANQKSYKKWQEDGKYQLALYSYALEKGLTELPAAPVIGAFYYSAKTMQREKGFRVSEAVGPLFAENRRNSTHIQENDKQLLFVEMTQSIQQKIESMLQGKFAPDPRDSDVCSSCQWKKVCRSPHLN